jgi:threonine/homoserine/homoserine lactone efflux protein
MDRVSKGNLYQGRSMPTPSTLLIFLGAALVLAALPGPGQFYIAGRTLASGSADGLASCLGTALGGVAHVIAGAVGVSVLIMASATAFGVVKLVGGLYLLYLGFQTWRSADAPLEMSETAFRSDVWRALRQGAVVEATNPKTAAFFLALIPQFVDPARGSAALQFAVFGLVSIALNTGMAMLVVGAASALRQRVIGHATLLRRLRQGSAAVLAALGLTLLLTRRPA